MDKPLTSRFLKVEQDSIISGTIPRDTETRPHVQASVDDSALAGQADPDSKPIGLIGPADDGVPNKVYKITSLEEAKAAFGGGPLVEAIELAWQPGALAYNNGGTIYAERVQNASQATLNTGALHFYSTIYGNKANNIQIALEHDPLLEDTWDLTVTNKQDSYRATYNGLGLLAYLQYVPNAWDKNHIPAGQKDYARASFEVKPNIEKHKLSNGSVVETSNGQANRLVFHIHDTKRPGIFYNNVTNNVDGGSTVYNVDDPGYNGDVPTETESDEPASAGDLNPNRGPFVDSTFSIDLTNPKFASMVNLLTYLQQLNFSGNAHLEVEANEDRHLSHIPPYLMDLTNHNVSIMPNVDDTTQDKHGNIQHPGSLWSTLGDIVDALRYDREVHAKADTRRQLNIISTVPSGASTFLSQASRDAESARAASMNASYDYSEASDASNNNVPSLAATYKSIGDSYAADANSYEDIISSANSDFWLDVNSAEYNPTKADKTAASTLSSARKATASAKAHLPKLSKLASQASVAASDENKKANSFGSELSNRNSKAARFTSLAHTFSLRDSANHNSSLAGSISSANSEAKKATPAAKMNFLKSNHSNFASKASADSKNASKLGKEVAELKAEIAKAHKAVQASADNARKVDNKVDSKQRPNAEINMRYVQNYVNNLIAQVRQQLKASKHPAMNIIDSDLDSLSRVIRFMSDPSRALDTKTYEAGKKAVDPLSRLLNDLKDLKNNVKGSLNAADEDLGFVNAAIHFANPSKPAPHDILGYTFGDGVINILGEPIHAFINTNLTGGYTGQVPIDWSNKFKYFNNTPVYDFVALSPRESVHANLAAYVGDRYQANHNMRGFVGSGYNTSAQELIDRASALDNERICLYGTSGDYTITDGLHKDIPAYLGAAIVAGIDSGLRPGDSLTNKKIAYNKIDQNFDSSTLNETNANGVITANPIVNRGVASEYTLSNDVTTNNDDSDPVKAQLSIGEVTDFLFDDLRMYLQRNIGTPVTTGSADQLVTSVNAFLHNHCSKYYGDGLIVDYQPDDTYCEIHNESAFIEFNVAPTVPLKYINVVGKYSSFDENSGGDNQATFEFIGANGVESSDDDTDGAAGEDSNQTTQNGYSF